MVMPIEIKLGSKIHHARTGIDASRRAGSVGRRLSRRIDRTRVVGRDVIERNRVMLSMRRWSVVNINIKGWRLVLVVVVVRLVLKGKCQCTRIRQCRRRWLVP